MTDKQTVSGRVLSLDLQYRLERLFFEIQMEAFQRASACGAGKAIPEYPPHTPGLL